MPKSPLALTRREAITLLSALIPTALLAGCGGGGSGSSGSTDSGVNVYLALGDSYAYGYSTQTDTPSGVGDQGYVKPFADWLAGRLSSGRPAVRNLAIPGETTTSFLRTANGPPVSEYNLRYADSGGSFAHAPGQGSLLAITAADIAGRGQHPVAITLQIGGNNLLDLVTDPAFLAANDTQRQALIDAAFATIDADYTAILLKVRAAAPSAPLFLVGYPDPFAGLEAGNPLAGISTPTIQRLNTLIAAHAAADTRGAFVDIYTPFLGHETAYTLITLQDPAGSGIPDFHPSAVGYGIIADQLIIAATGRIP